MTITINASRLHATIAELSQFTEANTPGWTRRFPSEAYKQSRRWLRQQMEATGLTTELDAVGNLFGRSAGREALPALHIGSHTDTVMGGGRFDGVLGVIGGLEVVRTLRDANYQLRHPLILADYLSEEATDYAIACMGSLARYTDHFKAAWLDRTVNGISLRQAIADMGGQPDQLGHCLVQPGEIAAALELHIEQGPVLEARGARLAAVSGIVGIRRAVLELRGKANHAGATPMDLRQDAMAAAARIICAVEDIARAHPGTVGTIGKVEVRPNQGNVIAAQVTMMPEMRSLNMNEVDGMWAQLMTVVANACNERGVTYQLFNDTRMDSVIPPAWLHETVLHICRQHDPKAIVTPSGAGHDTNYVALLAPAAMIFVPSIDGRSHAPEEFTQPEDLALGVQVLAEAIIALDQQL
jgi:N-carbamoyl-L-amino-acid hydrolase